MAYTNPNFQNNNTPAINATNLNDLANAVQKLGVENGGTGRTTLASGALIMGNGTSPVGNLYGVGALYSQTSGNPQFGTLPVSCGGTGVSTMAQLRSNISVFLIQTAQPQDTSGNILWINPSDSTLNYYYNGQWRKILGVFGS